jgi:hypothetical protein
MEQWGNPGHHHCACLRLGTHGDQRSPDDAASCGHICKGLCKTAQCQASDASGRHSHGIRGLSVALRTILINSVARDDRCGPNGLRSGRATHATTCCSASMPWTLSIGRTVQEASQLPFELLGIPLLHLTHERDTFLHRTLGSARRTEAAFQRRDFAKCTERRDPSVGRETEPTSGDGDCPGGNPRARRRPTDMEAWAGCRCGADGRTRIRSNSISVRTHHNGS